MTMIIKYFLTAAIAGFLGISSIGEAKSHKPKSEKPHSDKKEKRKEKKHKNRETSEAPNVVLPNNLPVMPPVDGQVPAGENVPVGGRQAQ